MTAALAPGARVLITGAGGFIGRHLAAALGATAQVHGTSRTGGAGRDERVRWHRCDPASIADVRRVFAEVRPEYVLHLSSLADGRRDLDLVLPIFESETVAAVNVLTVAAAAGVRRIVIPGSLEEPDAGEPPASPYAAAKAATRAYAGMFHGVYELPVIMTRVFMTYGPGQPGWKLIPSVAASLMRGESPLVASPDRQVDWIYVDDVVAGLIAALLAPGLEGGSVDLGSGELTGIRDLVERLARLLAPSAAPRFGDGSARGQERVCRADVAATRRLLGWEPRVGLDEGLRRTINALRQTPAS